MLEPTIWRIFVVSKVLFFTLAIFSASFLTPIWNDMEVIQSSAYLTSNAFDRALRAILNNYSRWDGTHILVIAMEGYRWESQHAFFPLLPLLMRIGALILYPIPISLLTRCQLTGVFISMISHYFTINNIRQITAIVFPKQKRFINLCTLFATIPPSTPFINATYSESLFAALSTAGMLSLLQRRNLSALGLFLLAGLARSNGIFLSGFFLHQMILSRDFIALATNLILFIISTSPFFLFQMYGVSKYCDPSPVDGKIRSWCTPKLPLQLPNLYSFVQGRYWNVGLFKYFTPSQIPNFLIAAPMLVICGYTCWVYFSSDPLGIFFRALGIQYPFPPSIQPSKTLQPQNICTVPTENKYMRGRRGFADSIDLQSSSNDYELNSLTRIKRGKINIPNSPNYLKDLNTNVLILPHMVLLAVMLLINFFYSHVQIIARLFSFMPCVYWCMALIYQSLDTSQKWYSGYLKRSILIYCLVQVVVGSILFMNHMPPA